MTHPSPAIVKYHMRDQIFDVCFETVWHMSGLIILTPIVPWSYCVVLVFAGMSGYGDPVIVECWGTLRAALDYVGCYADVTDLRELSMHYADCDTIHFDYEIWHLVPWPYAVHEHV